MSSYTTDSSEKKCKTRVGCRKKTCCGCDGVAIALGIFALGLFIVIATALVLFVVFCPCPISIIVLIISTIIAFFILSLICRLVKVCISSHHSCYRDGM